LAASVRWLGVLDAGTGDAAAAMMINKQIAVIALRKKGRR
jgi:hypothetical protein